LDEFVIMPDHARGIVIIGEGKEKRDLFVGTHGRASLQRRPRSLSSFVAGYNLLSQSGSTSFVARWRSLFGNGGFTTISSATRPTSTGFVRIWPTVPCNGQSLKRTRIMLVGKDAHLCVPTEVSHN
jgi:hypothetical protein